MTSPRVTTLLTSWVEIILSGRDIWRTACGKNKSFLCAARRIVGLDKTGPCPILPVVASQRQKAGTPYGDPAFMLSPAAQLIARQAAS
jgi:hypothetical protein